MKLRLAVFLAGIAACAVTHVTANDGALQKCRTQVDAKARLACYDAIVLPASAAPSVTQTGATTGAKPAVQSNATASATTDAKAVSATAKPAGAADTAADFGLPSVVRAAQLEQIESTIPGHFASWQTGSRISLANGQVWQVTDDSRGICECDNPKVIVSRGSFGTFFLDIEGKGNSPRVRRIK